MYTCVQLWKHTVLWFGSFRKIFRCDSWSTRFTMQPHRMASFHIGEAVIPPLSPTAMHTTKGCAAARLCLAFTSLLASTAHAQCTDASLCQATTQTLDHGGVQREFHVITPPGKNPGDAAAAVIVGVHGYTQNGKMACEAMLQPYVRELDVIGVCPTGKEQMDPSYGVPTTGWNIGVIDGHHDTWAVHDDVDFIKQAKNFALAQYAVAGNVTYAIGFSMGADMVFQLMCVASSQYSGFAMVGEIGPYKATYVANMYKGEPKFTGEPIKLGTVQGDWARSMVGYSETCDPTPAKPIWQAIGTADDLVSEVVRVPEDMLASWNHNADTILGCAATVTKTKRNDLVECHERAECTEMEPAGKTEICIYEGMQHIYPSVPTAPQDEAYSDANGAGASYQATPAAWAFWNKKTEESATTSAPTAEVEAVAEATSAPATAAEATSAPASAAAATAEETGVSGAMATGPR